MLVKGAGKGLQSGAVLVRVLVLCSQRCCGGGDWQLVWRFSQGAPGCCLG